MVNKYLPTYLRSMSIIPIRLITFLQVLLKHMRSNNLFSSFFDRKPFYFLKFTQANMSSGRCPNYYLSGFKVATAVFMFPLAKVTEKKRAYKDLSGW